MSTSGFGPALLLDDCLGPSNRIACRACSPTSVVSQLPGSASTSVSSADSAPSGATSAIPTSSAWMMSCADHDPVWRRRLQRAQSPLLLPAEKGGHDADFFHKSRPRETQPFRANL